MRRPDRLLVGAGAALFLTMLDTTVVTVALPDLQTHSGLGVPDLQWLVDGYLVVFAALTLAGGALADRLGRRALLLTGLVVFAVGSVVTATGDPTGGWDAVRVGRLVQGLGAALSEPATLAVVRVGPPGGWPDARARARALGAWAAVAGLAVALGPLAGGVLVAIGGWRAVFWANVPLAAAALVLAARGVPASRDPVRDAAGHRVPLDLPGLALAAVALGGVAWGLIEGQVRGFGSTPVLAALVLAGVAAVGFVVAERAAPHPALPLPVALGRRTGGATVAVVASSFAVYAVYFFVSLDVQTVAGGGAGGTLLAFAPLTAVLVGGALVAARWSARHGARTPLLAGLLVGAAGLLLTDRVLAPDPSLPAVAAALVVVGAGLGLVLGPAADVVLSAARPQQAGVAAAAVNLARQTGGLLAVAVLGAVAVGRLQDSLAAQLEALRVPGFLRGYVTDLVLHPGSQGVVSARSGAGDPGLVGRVVRAAQESFLAGSHTALLLTAGVLVAAALLLLALPPDRPGRG